MGQRERILTTRDERRRRHDGAAETDGTETNGGRPAILDGETRPNETCERARTKRHEDAARCGRDADERLAEGERHDDEADDADSEAARAAAAAAERGGVEHAVESEAGGTRGRRAGEMNGESDADTAVFGGGGEAR